MIRPLSPHCRLKYGQMPPQGRPPLRCKRQRLADGQVRRQRLEIAGLHGRAAIVVQDGVAVRHADPRVQRLDVLQHRRVDLACVLEVGSPFDRGKIPVDHQHATNFQARLRIGPEQRVLVARSSEPSFADDPTSAKSASRRKACRRRRTRAAADRAEVVFTQAIMSRIGCVAFNVAFIQAGHSRGSSGLTCGTARAAPPAKITPATAAAASTSQVGA